MKVHLNAKRCEAFGICEQTAPRVYRLDDDGVLHVSFEGQAVPESHQDEARAGARACPVAALSVED